MKTSPKMHRFILSFHFPCKKCQLSSCISEEDKEQKSPYCTVHCENCKHKFDNCAFMAAFRNYLAGRIKAECG